MYSVRKLLWVAALLMLAACGNNLIPSDEDRRPAIPADTTGPAVGQKAPDFEVSDTNGNIVTLASALAGRKAAVLYFTMWCPVCDSHMSDMRSTVVPFFPDVGFFAVDYVSGSVNDARAAQLANGYSDFQVLADIHQTMLGSYRATMGTTVVIDSTGIIRMNEDYRDGSNLKATLAGLP